MQASFTESPERFTQRGNMARLLLLASQGHCGSWTGTQSCHQVMIVDESCQLLFHDAH